MEGKMGNRSYRPSRWEHPTETDPRVFAYLERRFGMAPVVNEIGADLIINGTIRVEVKSAQEWCITNHSCGKRRRGRFALHGYEDCDFFLFVLVRENNSLEMYLMEYEVATKRFGVMGTINWKNLYQAA